jgi:hypothetical protein
MSSLRGRCTRKCAPIVATCHAPSLDGGAARRREPRPLASQLHATPSDGAEPATEIEQLPPSLAAATGLVTLPDVPALPALPPVLGALGLPELPPRARWCCSPPPFAPHHRLVVSRPGQRLSPKRDDAPRERTPALLARHQSNAPTVEPRREDRQPHAARRASTDAGNSPVRSHSASSSGVTSTRLPAASSARPAWMSAKSPSASRTRRAARSCVGAAGGLLGSGVAVRKWCPIRGPLSPLTGPIGRRAVSHQLPNAG